MKRITLPITNQQLATEYLESDITTRDLGTKYGVSHQTIERRLEIVDCKMRPNHIPKKKLPRSKMVANYDGGMNLDQLADIHGCNRSTIANRLHDAGCDMRPTHKVEKEMVLSNSTLVEKYESGLDTYQLAEICGCHHATIGTRLVGMGCSLRHITTEEGRRMQSARMQGISYDEWESFATDSPYCPMFNEPCRESNREKYGRRCFITGVLEDDNVSKTGKVRKLSVHHVDMNKNQGCEGIRWKLVPMLMGQHTKMHSEVWEARIEYLLEHVWYPDGVWAPDALC